MARSPLVRALLASAVLGCGCASAVPPSCNSEAGMPGMRERVNTLHEQVNRIEWTPDRTQRRALIDLHVKHMHEGLRELRHRDLTPDCRMEVMAAMMEEMARLQEILVEQDTR